MRKRRLPRAQHALRALLVAHVGKDPDVSTQYSRNLITDRDALTHNPHLSAVRALIAALLAERPSPCYPLVPMAEHLSTLFGMYGVRPAVTIGILSRKTGQRTPLW